MSASRLKAGAALIEPEEPIYVNMEELADTEHQGPQEAENKPVRAASVAEEETESQSSFKVATVCLGLLCFLLLTAVVSVTVVYDRDFNQLTRELANHTAEERQLQIRYQNLTEERDQLQDRLERATHGSCPDGWRKFGCSCYILSASTGTWDDSRQRCLIQGAHLVIVNSWEEMVFLNELGARSKFWLGLDQSSSRNQWTWIDGSSPRTT
ncbi:C-type lectin domain family 6 member A-like [Brachyistius frenatus]|uniref:C-type lectin domain family 6 member A-like n=1 Tax=Brachyistius frenatus TaxID=100188 RepID=UPI0037E7FE99